MVHDDDLAADATQHSMSMEWRLPRSSAHGAVTQGRSVARAEWLETVKRARRRAASPLALRFGKKYSALTHRRRCTRSSA
jgi:hypothetical protein